MTIDDAASDEQVSRGSSAHPPRRATLSRVSKRWRKHPIRTIVLDLAVISAAVFGGFALLADSFTGDESEDAPSDVTQGPAEPQPSPPPSPTTGDAALSPAPGTCLQSSEGESLVDCDAAHAYEIFSTTDCSEASLLRYLGGQPGVEQVLVAPTTVRVGDQDACVFANPSDEPRAGSAEGVLQTDDHSIWRVCFDGRVAAEVPCSEPHTGEAVTPQPDEGPLDCTRAVEDYLGIRLRDLDGRLRVVALQPAEGPQCRIETTGADLLTGSLRNVGTRSIPFQQG